MPTWLACFASYSQHSQTDAVALEFYMPLMHLKQCNRNRNQPTRQIQSE